MSLSPAQVCLPLVCPRLLDLTLSLLPKPWNWKVSTGGTYRLMFDSYALLTMGVNVKNWSVRKDLNIFLFVALLPPSAVLWQTNEDAYAHMTATLLKTACTLGHGLKPEHILTVFCLENKWRAMGRALALGAG